MHCKWKLLYAERPDGWLDRHCAISHDRNSRLYGAIFKIGSRTISAVFNFRCPTSFQRTTNTRLFGDHKKCQSAWKAIGRLRSVGTSIPNLAVQLWCPNAYGTNTNKKTLKPSNYWLFKMSSNFRNMVQSYEWSV